MYVTKVTVSSRTIGEFRMNAEEVQDLITNIKGRTGWGSPPPHPEEYPVTDPLMRLYHALHVVLIGPW
jgi:hypothetical protein